MKKKTKIIIITILSIVLLIGIFVAVNYVIYKTGHDSLIWKLETKKEVQEKNKPKAKKELETTKEKELDSKDEASSADGVEQNVVNKNNDNKSNTKTNNNSSVNNNVSNNTARNNYNSSSNNSNNKPSSSSSHVSSSSQNTNTNNKPACTPKKFDMSWFRPDFLSYAECDKNGKTYLPKYAYDCDHSQDDCGVTWYMLILKDENGTYDWHTIQ